MGKYPSQSILIMRKPSFRLLLSDVHLPSVLKHPDTCLLYLHPDILILYNNPIWYKILQSHFCWEDLDQQSEHLLEQNRSFHYLQPLLHTAMLLEYFLLNYHHFLPASHPQPTKNLHQSMQKHLHHHRVTLQYPEGLHRKPLLLIGLYLHLYIPVRFPVFP